MAEVVDSIDISQQEDKTITTFETSKKVDTTVVYPSPFLKAVLTYPGLTLFLSLLLALPLTFFGATRFSLSDPQGGQIVKETVEAERAHAFARAVEALQGSSSTQRQPQQTKQVDMLTLYYVAGSTSTADEARTSNVLSASNVQKMWQLEEKLTSLTNFSNVCLRLDGQTSCAPIVSCVPYLINATNAATLKSSIDAMYDHSDLATKDNSFGVNAKWFFEQAKAHDRYTSYVVRTQIKLGGPMFGFNNWQDDNRKQKQLMKDIYLKEAEVILLQTMQEWKLDSKDNLNLLFNNGLLFGDETSSTILGDLLLTVGSLAFIFVIMVLHTGSFFLAGCGLLQVLLSFPVALCLYSVVFRIKLFGVLQVAGIFIILGIGADDIFILTDALKQLKIKKTNGTIMSRDERFARAFNSSFTTMLTTSMTTSFAFGMTAVIKIPTVRYMGVFAMTMVICNFIMVCTVYLSCLIIWDTYIRTSCRCCCSNATSSGNNESYGHNAHNESEAKDEDRGIVSAAPLSLSKCLDPYYQNIVAPRIVRHPKKIIVFFVVLSLVFLGFASQFREPDTQEPANPYWPPEHKVSRRTQIDVFALRNASADAGVQVRVVFGIDTIDRTGTDPTDDDDLGETIYVKNFDMTNPKSQEYMVQVCNAIVASASSLDIAYDNNGVLNFNCFMTIFKQWRLDRRESFPVPDYLFIGSYREFLGRNASKSVRDQVGLGLVEDVLSIKFVNLKATTTMPLVSLRVQMQSLEAKWTSFLSDLPSPPASIGKNVFPVSYSFLLAQVYEQAISVAWTTVALSMTITLFVIMAFTKNWQISLLAALTIGLIVITVVGFIKMLDWVLNPYIATCITILVGFSVDYTVHMAVAFAEAGSVVHSRKDKVTLAVGTMGVSVTAGALSTAGASAFLLGATITFFNNFGIFILSAVCSAYIFAMYFFPALLALVGPEGTSGELPSFLQCKRPLRERPPTKLSVTRALVVFVLCVSALLALVFGLAIAPPPPPPRPPGATSGTATQIATDTAAADAASKEEAKKTYLPALSTLSTGWHELKPGGRTMCSRGSPFSFFFKKGEDTEHVILEFMGGGACWNELTCGLRTGTFNENIEGIRRLWLNGKDVVPSDYSKKPGHSSYAFNSGINDPSAPNFKTWSRIYIPYCTGDLHWGDADVQYGDVFIRHRGAENARTAVDWMYKNFPQPKTIFVTGCSAGSYASVFWASKVGLLYSTSSPTSKIVQFGDSGSGIVTQTFLNEAFVNWNSAKNMPWAIIPVQLQGDKSNAHLTNFSLVDFYRYGAAYFPSHTYSQFNAQYDNNQAFFWLSMLHPHVRAPSEPSLVDKRMWGTAYRRVWNGTSAASAALLALPNYYSWTGWGDNHCVVPYNRYWSQSIGSTDVAKWVSSLVKEDGVAARVVDCRGTTGVRAPCDYGMEVKQE